MLRNDRSSLTISEWRLLSNVIHAFDKFSAVSSISNTIEHLNITKPINIDASTTLDLFASIHTAVESFIISTADFRVLTLTEQRSLFQRNLHALYIFCGNFMFRDGGAFENTKNKWILVPLYGEDNIRRVVRMNMRLGSNSALIKIMCIIIAFSTNCYTVNFDKGMYQDALLRGSFRLFGSQNMYVEILWKYMLYRYNYMEAALRFADLVKYVLDLIRLSADFCNTNIHHKILIDDVIEQAKTTLTLNDNKSVPLWGKTL